MFVLSLKGNLVKGNLVLLNSVCTFLKLIWSQCGLLVLLPVPLTRKVMYKCYIRVRLESGTALSARSCMTEQSQDFR